MKAFLFAAGLGTRLRPITNDRPKALAEVNGQPLLKIAIDYLINHGCTEIMVNVHHFAQQVKDYLAAHSWTARITISDETDLLLDTGGGLWKGADFFNDGLPFVAMNVDILTDLDLKTMYEHHLQSGASVSLAVLQRKSSRMLLFDEKQRLQGWLNTQTLATKPVGLSPDAYKAFAFSGIHIIDPALLGVPAPSAVFSIIDLYLSVMHEMTIAAYPHYGGLWMDLGTPAQLEKAALL